MKSKSTDLIICFQIWTQHEDLKKGNNFLYHNSEYIKQPTHYCWDWTSHSAQLLLNSSYEHLFNMAHAKYNAIIVAKTSLK